MKSFVIRSMTHLIAMAAVACASSNHKPDRFRTLTVAKVDLERFMGPWYVQGHTPFLIDHDSSNQIESYQLLPDGTIATTFTFDRNGKTSTFHPKGWVIDKETNAYWKMRVFWPFAGDYLIVRLAPDYSMTVVSVPSRDLIWIMTRNKDMPEQDYEAVTADLKQAGFDLQNLRRVPQNS